MTRKTDPPPRTVMHPPEPCVWMSAGLLAFHLCDRHYDCEHCPLDASLRRADLATETGRDPDRPPGRDNKGPMWEFRSDRLYGPGHCWIQERHSGRLRYGLDAFAASLLAPLQGVIYPARGTWLERNGILCWLRAGEQPFPVPSPVGGRFTQSNPQVRADASHLTVSPYDDGWLAEISDYSSSDLRSLDDASQACRRAMADNQVLLKELDVLVHREKHLGATLPDGGLPVTGLRELLGEPVYVRLVKRFLR